MISKNKPDNFTPKFEVVSCFVEYKDEILLLLRQDHKPQPNTYGVPAGKVDPGETLRKAMKREGKQETTINLHGATYIDKLFVRYDDYDFVYHMFIKKFEKEPKVSINIEEHKSYTRVNPKKALEMNLIQDLDECITLFYKDKINK
ncbi:MAG: NUDIX hydrolase [bacterium]